MKRLTLGLALASFLTLAALPAPAFDVKTDTFQVTGEVTAVDATSFTVMKGKERFHIAKDATTKVTGELKQGAKVTVKYQMIAVSVEAKEAKAPAKKK